VIESAERMVRFRAVRVLCVIGTRPEAIKLAPLILALQSCPDAVAVRICVTAQHRDLLDGVLRHFGLDADDDLDVMRPNQSLADLTTALFAGLGPLIADDKPDWLVVQGDTTSAMAAAVAGFQAQVRVAHVEAGLRTGRADDPFPEEMNRTLIARVADLHFAPTERARVNLIGEGIEGDRVFVTGNTGIDALHWTLARMPARGQTHPAETGAPRRILVTLHRREAFGAPFAAMCHALRELASRAGHRARLVCPVHPNPNAANPLRSVLEGVPNIQLIDPVDYPGMVALLSDCHFVMTDSGGLQEEGPALGKPVLVLRETTERPEGIEAGAAELVGRDPRKIVEAGMRLLTDEEAYARMARVACPYGDGHAAERIVTVLRAQRKGAVA
jgi:UDP-N-acetylglucosamine 2-epimerase (non-hydrolysing)